jgi:transposase InsO family protein
MLALVWGLQHYRTYLFRKVTWVTDHSALTHLIRPGREPPNQRIARWMLALQDYEIKPLHSPGKDLADADALSRMDAANSPSALHSLDVALHSLDSALSAVASIADVQELKAAQLADPVCALVSRLVRGEVKVDDSLLNSRVRQLYKTHKFVHDSDGVLQMMWEPSAHVRSGCAPSLCTYVPISLVTQVISLTHDDKLTGHQGINRTYERIREAAWWPTMVEDIAAYVSACDRCQKHKIAGRLSVPVQPMGMPSAPWMQVSIDTVGPLHTTRNGNKYIICMVDYFTRYCEAQAVNEQSTHTVLQAVYKQVICRHGVPNVLISDNGSPYTSEVAKQMFNRLGIKRHYSSAYHPQSNGAVERFNRTLKETLRVWANENADDWDEMLPYALFAYNTAYHSTIKNTPFYLEHARLPRLPLDVQLGRVCTFFEDYDSYVYQMSQRIYHTHADVQRIYEQITAQRTEAVEVRNKRLPSFSPGQLVYVRDLTAVHKLYPKWVGPYQVVKKVSEVVYELNINNEVKSVHLDRIKIHHTHTRPALDLEKEIGHFHSLLELSRVEAKQALECQQRVEARLAELQQQQAAEQASAASSALPSTSSSESSAQPDSASAVLTHSSVVDTSMTVSDQLTQSVPATTQSATAPRRGRPPLRARTAHVAIPSTAPTYSGVLRARPAISYSE